MFKSLVSLSLCKSENCKNVNFRERQKKNWIAFIHEHDDYTLCANCMAWWESGTQDHESHQKNGTVFYKCHQHSGGWLTYFLSVLQFHYVISDSCPAGVYI